jgi:multidrug efflux pump subunit AcrB
MINRLIHWSLHHRFIVLAGFLALCAWGVVALTRVPIDAIPDLSENQVIVYADWPGRSPQEVEDQITYPLSVSLQGLAGVKTVRATSMFGFSFLTVIFEDKVDTYFARTRVLERLNSLGELLPGGVVARLGPDATGLGWIYQYYLKDESGTQDLGSLRALQDTFVRYQLASVPGVAEVASLGGFVRQWQVEVSALKLKQYGVMLGEVMDAVAASNRNIGGKTIEENGAEYIVRGVGLVQSAADLESIALLPRNGTPLLLHDVATVRIGGDFRRGALDVNGRQVVGGIVVMRYGENAWQVIQDVKARLATLAPGLPAGVTVRVLLRPQRPHRPRHRHAEARADRGDPPRDARAHPVPLPLPQHPDRHAAAAGLDPDLVHPDGSVRHPVAHHVAHRHRHLHRRAGGRRHRDDGKCHPPLRARRGGAEAPPHPAGGVHPHARGRHPGRPADVLLDAGHHPGLRAGVSADRPGGQALPPARLHQELRAARRGAAGHHGRPGVLHHPRARPLQARERELADEGLLKIYEPVLDWALVHRKTVLGCAVALLAASCVIAFGLPRPS